MIQDIYPEKLDNSYVNIQPSEGDTLLFYDEKGRVLLSFDEPSGEIFFPLYGKEDLSGDARDSHDFTFLFSVSERNFFLTECPVEFTGNFSYYSLREIRAFKTVSKSLVYAAYTGYHLWKWYADNKFCGRCGKLLYRDGSRKLFSLLNPSVKESDEPAQKTERALVCPSCGNRIYPRINPAVIVGVVNGDRLLITKYRHGYANSALVAGFTEIGETLEETVAREVMEEVGLKVKNIRYYKSQPWGMALDILTGFYCEVDGDDTIKMDENELKYAEWVNRDEIELQPSDYSLTNEMMKKFKNGERIF